ncbi:enoyl-CoA-hydratase DpgB [Catenuloplanes atrovinosus]|uniref:Isomerase DpgB n=1 Tax=Catenuloplanes atrovinosus TaxID=137266 RepID=A0AAE3YNA2_9ACTN|nr:enoyl-CoA-hydratase DpgB [Catenuloplanes atrovinosus]MDR7276953.1 isomerase DpgB [Catenuloplanes atrovinosus]
MVTAAGVDDLVLRVDGSRPPSAAEVEAVQRLCDRAEDDFGAGVLVVYASGAPLPGWTRTLDVGLVTKWERTVRRLERLGLTTVAVAAGDCGGIALDVLLAADVRIAAAGARLVVPVGGDATWPGMALYRLARQGGARGLRRAALLGTPIEAEAAASAGLIDVVTEEPGGALAEVAAAAAAMPGSEVAIRRQLMLEAGQQSFDEALGAHLAACDRTLRRAAAS